MHEVHSGRNDDVRSRTVVVVVGGGPVRALAVDADLVIAADSGLDGALRAGLRPDLVVGDLDSVSDAALDWARREGVPVETHPVDKDLTDTALALRRAAETAGGELIVLAPDGETVEHRLDHVLGVIAALGDPVLAGFVAVRAHLGNAVLHVLHPGRTVSLDLATGSTFSLIAAHGPCSGVDLAGASWPLHDADLPAASTRGISNTVAEPPLVATVATGVLTIVVPEATR